METWYIPRSELLLSSYESDIIGSIMENQKNPEETFAYAIKLWGDVLK